MGEFSTLPERKEHAPCPHSNLTSSSPSGNSSKPSFPSAAPTIRSDATAHASPSGWYHRIADASCSESTLRRRRDEWIELGLMDRLRQICLKAYDRLIGLELSEVVVDCCITKAPCGGEKAGRSPVDRGKRGVKRSMAVDARGIPLGAVSAPANRHDSPLLVPTIEATSEALKGGEEVQLPGFGKFYVRAVVIMGGPVTSRSHNARSTPEHHRR